MSTFAFFAFVILPILGGLIAWAGDVIGYRLGKSRRSLLGLRPRNTARLVGVSVGVLLPLVGLLTALAGSQEARDAVFRIGELRRQEATLTAANKQLKAQIAQAEAEAKTSEGRAEELRRNLLLTRDKLGQTQSQVEESAARLAGAERDVQKARLDAGGLRTAAEKLRQVKDRLLAQIAPLRDSLRQLQASLAQATSRLTETANELTLKGAALDETNARLDRTKRALDTLTEKYLLEIRSPVVFESGHELVWAIVDVPDDQAQVEHALRGLLVVASEAAEHQGAEVGPNKLAVRLARPWPPDAAIEGELPSESQIITYYASELRKQQDKRVVVGVRVSRRMYQAEHAQAQVEFWSKPYVKVFAEGDVVYAARIDGSGTRAEIYTQLYNLLDKLVRREAQERGLLPDPRSQKHGSLSAEQLIEALDTIAEHKVPVLVRAVAAKDTYTTDELVIKLEVKSAERPAGAEGSTGS
ncbi:MAG: DUF3084 domain-containing protein [Armatimonadia bacterium]